MIIEYLFPMDISAFVRPFFAITALSFLHLVRIRKFVHVCVHMYTHPRSLPLSPLTPGACYFSGSDLDA